MFKSNRPFICSIKRTVFLLSLLFITTNLHARISWDFELKAKPAVNFVNEKSLYENTQYIDFLAGAGLDITLCFGRYVGLDAFVSYLPICYPTPKLSENNWSVKYGLLGGWGLAVMVPLSDTLKMKTVIGTSILDYTKYKEKFIDEDGKEKDFGYYFQKIGWMGSVSCVWMPVKHFGLTFGTDLCIDSLKGEERKLPQSRYSYAPKYFQVYVSPYVGVVIKLGRNL